MKEKYLDELNELLKIPFNNDEANSIRKDYEELFSDYLSSGLTEEEVISKLGSPKEIVRSLIEEEKKIFPRIRKTSVILPKRGFRKIVAVMPILSLLIFLVLGYTMQAWHPGWLIFLLVPLSSVIFAPYKRDKIVSVTPVLAVIIFILVGTFVDGGYRYSWIAFLLIPLVGALSAKDD